MAGFAIALRRDFALSCTRELLSESHKLARERGVMVHTHASENTTECEWLSNETG